MNNQLQNIDSLIRLPFIYAQCVIGSENFLDAGKYLKYTEAKNSQGYTQIVSCFMHLIEDDTSQNYIRSLSQNFSITNNVGAAGDPSHDSGFNSLVFGIRYQNKVSSAQPLN